MRVVGTLLMLSGASALTFAGRPGARAAHPRMQFGDFLKGFDEAKKSLEKDLGILTGGQELQDDGETEQEAKSRAERAAKNRKDEDAEEDDVPTKLFKFFLGTPEEGDVQGIARTASAPDTYPATKTEFAAPVEGDSAAIAHLRPLLKNTNLEFLSLRKAYDASSDGWSAEAFHSKVDLTGPCLVVCETEGGAVCGGYAPKGYAGYGEYRGSIAAFLFSWPDGDVSAPVIKLQKVGGAGLATVDEPETGPRFGMDGLVIRMDPGAERCAAEQQEAAHTLPAHPRRTPSPHTLPAHLPTQPPHTHPPHTLPKHPHHTLSPHTLATHPPRHVTLW